jgi:hypothetical protein
MIAKSEALKPKRDNHMFLLNVAERGFDWGNDRRINNKNLDILDSDS